MEKEDVGIKDPGWIIAHQANINKRKIEWKARVGRYLAHYVLLPFVFFIVQFFIPVTSPISLVFIAILRIGGALLFCQVVWIPYRADKGLTDLDIVNERYGLSSKELQDAVRHFFYKNDFGAPFAVVAFLQIMIIFGCFIDFFSSHFLDIFTLIFILGYLGSFFFWAHHALAIIRTSNHNNLFYQFIDTQGRKREALTSDIPPLPSSLQDIDKIHSKSLPSSLQNIDNTILTGNSQQFLNPNPLKSRGLQCFLDFSTAVGEEFEQLANSELISYEQLSQTMRNIGEKMHGTNNLPQYSGRDDITGLTVSGSAFYRTFDARWAQIMLLGFLVIIAAGITMADLGWMQPGFPGLIFLLLGLLIQGWWFYYLTRRELNVKKRSYPAASFTILPEGKLVLTRIAKVSAQAAHDAEYLCDHHLIWSVPYAGLIWAIDTFINLLNNPVFVQEIPEEIKGPEQIQNFSIEWEHALQSINEICSKAALKKPSKSEFLRVRDIYYPKPAGFSGHPQSEKIFRDRTGTSFFRRARKIFLSTAVISGMLFLVLFFGNPEMLQDLSSGERFIPADWGEIYSVIGLVFLFSAGGLCILIMGIFTQSILENKRKYIIPEKGKMFAFGSDPIYDAIMTERLKSIPAFNDIIQTIIRLEIFQWEPIFGSFQEVSYHPGDLNVFVFSQENYLPPVIPGFLLRFKGGEIIREQSRTVILGGTCNPERLKLLVETMLRPIKEWHDVSLSFPEEGLFKLELPQRPNPSPAVLAPFIQARKEDIITEDETVNQFARTQIEPSFFSPPLPPNETYSPSWLERFKSLLQAPYWKILFYYIIILYGFCSGCLIASPFMTYGFSVQILCGTAMMLGVISILGLFVQPGAKVKISTPHMPLKSAEKAFHEFYTKFFGDSVNSLRFSLKIACWIIFIVSSLYLLFDAVNTPSFFYGYYLSYLNHFDITNPIHWIRTASLISVIVGLSWIVIRSKKIAKVDRDTRRYKQEKGIEYYKSIGLTFDIVEGTMWNPGQGILIKQNPVTSEQREAFNFLLACRTILYYRENARLCLFLTFVPLIEMFLATYFLFGPIGNIIFTICVGIIAWVVYQVYRGVSWSLKARAFLGVHEATDEELKSVGAF